jgi:hypothetical protein
VIINGFGLQDTWKADQPEILQSAVLRKGGRFNEILFRLIIIILKSKLFFQLRLRITKFFLLLFSVFSPEECRLDISWCNEPWPAASSQIHSP